MLKHLGRDFNPNCSLLLNRSKYRIATIVLDSSFNFRLTKLCSSENELFTVAKVHEFICLLTVSGDTLEIIATRPFSCVTKELASLSHISLLAISPDGAVVFAVDQGQSLLFRMEVVSGNCKSFSLSKGFSCRYTVI